VISEGAAGGNVMFSKDVKKLTVQHSASRFHAGPPYQTDISVCECCGTKMYLNLA